MERESITEFPLPVPMTDGMWGTKLSLMNPPDNDGGTYVLRKGDTHSGRGIQVYSVGDMENIRAYRSDQDDRGSFTSYGATVLGDKPFLATWFDEWFGRFTYSLAHKIQDGKFTHKPRLPKVPKMVRGTKGWGWTKLSDLIPLLDSDPLGALPYWELVSFPTVYYPELPQELNPPATKQPIDDDDDDFEDVDYGLVDAQLAWFDDNRIEFEAISIVLDDPMSKMLSAGDSRAETGWDGINQGAVPPECDLANFDPKRVWVPAGLALDLLGIDFFIRLKCGRS